MLITITGPWKKKTKADLVIQLHSIAVTVNTYKTTLGIDATVVEKITAADVMESFIAHSRSMIVAWDKSITSYEDKLLEGNMLVVMPDFSAFPAIGTPPPATSEGVWHLIETQRKAWMVAPGYTPEIGTEMTILGPTQLFETDDYKPKLKCKTMPAYINITTDSAIIEYHNLYAAVTGQPLKFIISFKGSKYDYHRLLTIPGQPESVDLQVMGVYQNEEIGIKSDTVTVIYNG